MKTVSQVMDDRVESALEYLVDTDEEYARNNALLSKAYQSNAFPGCGGNSSGERINCILLGRI